MSLFFLSIRSYAQDFKFDRSKPIEVSADQLVVSDNKKTGEFIGNVQVIQDQYKLKSDRILINYSNNKKSDNVVSSIIAYNNVYLFSGKQQAAKAQKLEYNLNTKIIILSGNVVLSYNDSILKGQKIIFNTQTKNINVMGGKKERIKALLTIPE